MKVLDPKPREFVQVKRAGEKLWGEVLRTNPDGSMRLRCDSLAKGAMAPRKNTEFDVPANEVVLDRVKI